LTKPFVGLASVKKVKWSKNVEPEDEGSRLEETEEEGLFDGVDASSGVEGTKGGGLDSGVDECGRVEEIEGEGPFEVVNGEEGFLEEANGEEETITLAAEAGPSAEAGGEEFINMIIKATPLDTATNITARIKRAKAPT